MLFAESQIHGRRPVRQMQSIALGLRVFVEHLRYKAVVIFTDNEGVLGSLISCKSENISGLKLV